MSQVDWAIGGSVGGGRYRRRNGRRNDLLELSLRRCGTDCSTWFAACYKSTTMWLKGYIYLGG